MGERIDALLADLDYVLSTSEGTEMLLDAHKACRICFVSCIWPAPAGLLLWCPGLRRINLPERNSAPGQSGPMDEQAWLRFWITFGAAVSLSAVGGAVLGWIVARRCPNSRGRAALAVGTGIAVGLLVGFVCAPFVISASLR